MPTLFSFSPVFLYITYPSNVNVITAERTMGLLRKELQIRRGELLEQLFFASLERIFIEQRIYKEKKFEQAPDMDMAIAFVDDKADSF